MQCPAVRTIFELIMEPPQRKESLCPEYRSKIATIHGNSAKYVFSGFDKAVCSRNKVIKLVFINKAETFFRIEHYFHTE